MIPFLVVAVFFVPPIVLAWSLCRIAAEADSWCPADDDDVYCIYCDGTDLDDWGEPGWWSCRPCQMLFEIKEPLR